MFQIAETFSATYVPQGSVDGTDWTTQAVIDASTGNTVTSITAAGRWYLPPGSIPPFFRLDCTVYASGEPTGAISVGNSRSD